MKQVVKIIADTLGALLLLALIIAAAWVFDGTPDLWDKWHAEAMAQDCKQPPTKQ